MDDQRITPEQIQAELQGEFRALAEQMAAAMNAAKDGRIIADSEEPMRDAHALFRQQAYQKVIDLLAKQKAKEAFPPLCKATPGQSGKTRVSRKPRT